MPQSTKAEGKDRLRFSSRASPEQSAQSGQWRMPVAMRCDAKHGNGSGLGDAPDARRGPSPPLHCGSAAARTRGDHCCLRPELISAFARAHRVKTFRPTPASRQTSDSSRREPAAARAETAASAFPPEMCMVHGRQRRAGRRTGSFSASFGPLNNFPNIGRIAVARARAADGPLIGSFGPICRNLFSRPTRYRNCYRRPYHSPMIRRRSNGAFEDCQGSASSSCAFAHSRKRL